LHLQPAYMSYGFRTGQYPVSEQLASEIVSIPMYPELTNKQRQYVVDHIKKFIHR
jgi:dTDP-4-amino-4,6-dideoxygalactose transaminase